MIRGQGYLTMDQLDDYIRLGFGERLGRLSEDELQGICERTAQLTFSFFSSSGEDLNEHPCDSSLEEDPTSHWAYLELQRRRSLE